jgi:hypothetical protein
MFRVAEVLVAGVAIATRPITEPFNKNSAWLRLESAEAQVEVIAMFVLVELRVLDTELPVITNVGAFGATGARASMFTFEVDASEPDPLANGSETLLTLPTKSVTLPVPDQPAAEA